MKNIRKICLVLLAVAALSLFAGCSTPQNSNEDAENNNLPSSTTAENVVPIAEDSQTASGNEEYIPSINDTIMESIDSRRDTFYSRLSDTKTSGVIYYISNSGNDSNDGLSPETAWATLDRAFETYWPLKRNFLKPGDSVLLERGGTWYVSPDERDGLTSDAYNIVEGVTLGAYGEGPRPVIRGDLPDANSLDFWTLYHDENGVKIWSSTTRIQDSNIVVLNDGESWSEEIMPHWSTALNNYCNEVGSPFVVENELAKNLTFCILMDMDGYSPGQDLSNPVQSATIYLRCDEGNPAEIFDEIALPQAQTGLALHTDAALVDLDLRYFTCIAAELSGYDGNSGQHVLNCEVSWCGGLLHNYQETDERPNGVLQPYCGGGALQVSGSNNSVRDCYIHHCGPMTLICTIHVDNSGKRTFENMTHSGNLIEYCGAALHIADLSKMDHADAEGFISNLYFTDNMVVHSGRGWIKNHILQISNQHSGFFSALENFMGASNNDGIYIKDNVFYASAANLLCLTDNLWNDMGKVNQPMVFSGNTYAQPVDGCLCNFNWEQGWCVGYTADEHDFLSFIGDTTGTVVAIP